MTTKRVTRESLAESITDALMVLQDHEARECTTSDVQVMIDLLRVAVIFLAHDDFDFVDISTQ